MTTSRRSGKRGRKPAKIDVKAKLERSRQSARECRARKKLRYQYLEELVSSREKAIFALRHELESLKQACVTLDKGKIPAELYQRLVIEGKSGVLDDSVTVPRTKDWCEVVSDTSDESQDSMGDSDQDLPDDLEPEYERSMPLSLTTAKGKGVGKSSVRVPVSSVGGQSESVDVTEATSENRTRNLLRLLGASDEQLRQLSGGDGGNQQQPDDGSAVPGQSITGSDVLPMPTTCALPKVALVTDPFRPSGSDVLSRQTASLPAQSVQSTSEVAMTTDSSSPSGISFVRPGESEASAQLQLGNFPANFSEEDIHDLMDIIIQSASASGTPQ